MIIYIWLIKPRVNLRANAEGWIGLTDRSPGCFIFFFNLIQFHRVFNFFNWFSFGVEINLLHIVFVACCGKIHHFVVSNYKNLT